VGHKLKLAECLEPGRTATTEKLRTITTKTASVSKGCVAGGNSDESSLFSHAVVLQPRNQRDTLWITEIERSAFVAVFILSLLVEWNLGSSFFHVLQCLRLLNFL